MSPTSPARPNGTDGDEASFGPEPASKRSGRRPDRSKDVALLASAIDILAEVGYDGMTMDLVAQRAGTTKSAMYRRWPSKVELILDAVARMQDDETDVDLPDTGTLRGDLVALTAPYSIERGEKKLRVMAGFASMLERHPDLADTASAITVEPWVDVCRQLISRAVERGEASAGDIEIASRVIPSMASYRVLVERRPVEQDYFIGLIDAVLVPALTGPNPRPA